MANLLPQILYEIDIYGNLTFINNQAFDSFGYSQEEYEKGFNVLKTLIPKDRDRAKENIQNILHGKSIGSPEYTALRKYGSTFPILIYSSTIVKENKPVGLRGIIVDITQRKKAEETLRASEEQYFTLFNNANDLIQVVNPAGKMLAVNKKWLATLEYSPEDLKGLRVTDIFREDKMSQIGDQLQEVTGGGTVSFETVFISKNGKEINVEGNGNGIFKYNKLVSMVGIFRDITKRKQAEERLKKTLDATIDTMSNMIEVKDSYISGHQHRICQLAISLARELGLPEGKVEGIRIASLIHDIGKISVPTEILSKTTTLSDIEFSLIKVHYQVGSDILKAIDFSYPVAQIVLQHHEKLNGSGYPNKLKGDKILLEACILGVADVVEAISSHRPYRPALGIDAALEEITQNKGILYDSEVGDAFIKLFKEKGFKFR